MNLINSLIDDQYEKKEITHTRNIVRAIVFNDEGKIALCHVCGDDIFGHRDYYETPGGGVEENEKNSIAIIRELDEEIGYKVKIIEEIGKVEDYYNLLSRRNINNYYLCKTIKQTSIHHESMGDSLIKEVIWVNLEKAIELYTQMPDNGVSLLVKRRELPILLMAKEMIVDSLEQIKNKCN